MQNAVLTHTHTQITHIPTMYRFNLKLEHYVSVFKSETDRSLTNYVLRLLWETEHKVLSKESYCQTWRYTPSVSALGRQARRSLWFGANLVHRVSSRTDNTEKPCLRARGGRGALLSYAMLMHSMTQYCVSTIFPDLTYGLNRGKEHFISTPLFIRCDAILTVNVLHWVNEKPIVINPWTKILLGGEKIIKSLKAMKESKTHIAKWKKQV